MKILPLLLVIMVISLAVQPIINLATLQAESTTSCCAGKCTPVISNDFSSSDQNQKNDCDGSMCNPFQVCDSCVLICQSFTFNRLKKLEISTKQGFNFQSDFTSPLPPDFWQPPKIV